MSALALPKPERRAVVSARARRADKRHADKVRADVLWLDHRCRAEGVHVACFGRLIVAHMEGHRRWQTRGLPPEQRHDVSWELALCARHGDLEERHVIRVRYLSAQGARGPVEWTVHD